MSSFITYKHLIIFTLMCEMINVCTMATNIYHSDLLKEMAAKAKIDTYVEGLNEGVHYRAVTFNGKPLTVVVEDGEVRHIGYSLFNNHQREYIGQDISNFIERYWLGLNLPLKRDKSVEREMYEDGFCFTAGSKRSLASLLEDTTLQITVSMDYEKQYTVQWKKTGKTLCGITFPINYELLLGRDMLENEHRLSEEIKTTYALPCNKKYSIEELVQSYTNAYMVFQGGRYYFDELSGNRYIVCRDKRFYPLYDMRYRSESIANLLTGTDIPEAKDFKLTLRQQLYNYQQLNIETNIRQFISFCIKNGCKPYVGVIGDEGGDVDVLLIMRNIALGYNHVVRMKVNLTNRTAIARLNAYVPTSNLRELFNDKDKIK